MTINENIGKLVKVQKERLMYGVVFQNRENLATSTQKSLESKTIWKSYSVYQVNIAGADIKIIIMMDGMEHGRMMVRF